MEPAVLVATRDAVAHVTLNRPAVLNALDAPMAALLVEALERLEMDPAVRVVVLKGAGAGFMAGGDVKLFAGLADRPLAERRRTITALIHAFHPAIVAMRRMPQPVIACVHGVAAGAGMSLMAAADLAIAGASATFTLAYARIGTSPDGGATWFLPRLVGQRRAMELALLPDRFDAARAEAIGLVNRVVPDDRLEAETAAIAARLAAGPGAAFANTKRLIHRSLEASFEGQLQAELESFASLTMTADFAEGTRAFAEKRPPRFGGG
ncbi:MAG: enoyl-CoA hydratase/isomerase family protein [Alphaproteobacteria bacterium]|nr:enoyl-CoA hydratase/isomerase family protein [Alphaproteobacteria bacterium]